MYKTELQKRVDRLTYSREGYAFKDWEKERPKDIPVKKITEAELLEIFYEKPKNRFQYK